MFVYDSMINVLCYDIILYEIKFVFFMFGGRKAKSSRYIPAESELRKASAILREAATPSSCRPRLDPSGTCRLSYTMNSRKVPDTFFRSPSTLCHSPSRQRLSSWRLSGTRSSQ